MIRKVISMNRTLTDAYEKGFQKTVSMKETLPGFPHITRQGKWLTNQNGHWTGGFWVGLLWLYAIETGQDTAKQEARDWAMRLRCRMADCTTHDQGFIFGPSCVMGYRITHDEAFLPLIHAGADNLVRQYVPETGLIQAWADAGYEGISIVDTIMNLPILWISGELSDDPQKKELCLKVAKNIQEHAIRADASTYHVIRWDRDFRIFGDTHQGYTAESCWSRGQAWALYGFANLYRYTGIPEFLDTSIRLAEYYWQHLNADRLPAWDFTFQDDTSMPIDAAASSIAVAGMLLLAHLLQLKEEPQQAEQWKKRADEILLAETEHCLYQDLDRYGIIEHAVVDYPHGSGIDESAEYGDYYFMEALYRKKHAEEEAALKLLY